MEEYVFRLTEELAARDIQVLVLCEKKQTDPSARVQVREFGVHRKPHWVSHFRFSQKVDRWLAGNPRKKRLVHSHERQSSHQVSTFHTTPFDFGKKKKLTHLISLRHRLLERLERREIKGSGVKAVVPVSSNLKQMLEAKHPGSSRIFTQPVFPGVSFPSAYETCPRETDPKGGVIGFMGKEWDRKGLAEVVEVWRLLQRTRPQIKLRIAGVEPNNITHLVREATPGVEILGWIEDKISFYQSIDLLFHPARKEAFGMIIAEAMSAGVPVLCSSECGASELIDEQLGAHFPVSTETESWVLTAEKLLRESFPMKTFSRTWSQVADEYVQLYQEHM